MPRTKLMLLSLIAALSAAGVLAQTASAKIKFAWLVLLSNGVNDLLGVGQTREFHINTDNKDLILSFTVSGGATLLLSTSASVEKGAKIIGGIPGTSEATATFTGVKVIKPAFEGKEACSANSQGQPAGTIKTEPLKSEIVESEETHEPLILFKPTTGNTFVTIEFNETAKECIIKGNKAAVTGSVLGEFLEPLAHLLTHHLILEAKTKSFLLSGSSTVETSGLSLGGKAGTFTGLFLILLTSDEKFGIC